MNIRLAIALKIATETPEALVQRVEKHMCPTPLELALGIKLKELSLKIEALRNMEKALMARLDYLERDQ